MPADSKVLVMTGGPECNGRWAEREVENTFVQGMSPRALAIGTGLATYWLRLASAVAPALVGFLVSAEGIGSVFLMFAAVSLIGALVASRMIETRGRQLEHIAA
jgi:hypothetical protein